MNFLPDVILLGQFPLAVGALTALLGGGLAYLSAGWVARRVGGDPEAAQDVILNLLVGGIAGAKLVYLLLDLPSYLANPVSLLLFPYGPLALPAGLLGGLVGVSLGLRRRTDRGAVLDHGSVPLALGLAVAAAGWKEPGTWTFAPLLGAATVAAVLLARRAGPGARPAPPGHGAVQTLILVCFALVLADLARPVAGIGGGISLLQLGAALAATGGWLWTRREARS